MRSEQENNNYYSRFKHLINKNPWVCNNSLERERLHLLSCEAIFKNNWLLWKLVIIWAVINTYLIFPVEPMFCFYQIALVGERNLYFVRQH